MTVKSKESLSKFKEKLYKLHPHFLKTLNLPFIDLVLLEKSEENGKMVVLGRLVFHEFFAFKAEVIEIFLKLPDGTLLPPHEIIETYLHEITHYHLFHNLRPPHHGKEFERRLEFIKGKFKNFLKSDRITF